MTEGLKRRQIADEMVLRQREQDGFERLVYQGDCMAPVLTDGCLVFIRRLSERELTRGDIVAFRRGGQVFIHRFLSTCRDDEGRCYLRTKADRYMIPDPLIPSEQYLGKAMCLKVGGRMIDLSTPGFRWLSGIIGLLSILEAVLTRMIKRVHPSEIRAGRLTKSAVTMVFQFPKFLCESAVSRWTRA